MAVSPQTVGGTQSHRLTARDIAAVFFRRKKLFLGVFLAVAITGILYSIFVPSYSSELRIFVRHGRVDAAVTPLPSAAPLLQGGDVSEEELNSEAELLTDEEVLRRVVKKTGLESSLLDRFRRVSEEQRTQRAVARLRKQLKVTPARKSRLIHIAYRSSSPRRTASVLNTLADAALARRSEIVRPTGQQTFFDQQLEQSRAELESAQSKLLRFTRKHKVASAALQRDLLIQKLSDAQSAELTLQSSIAEGQQRVHALDEKLRALPQHRIVQVRNADNPQLQERLKSKLLELELKRTELLTRFQPSYRLVQEVDRQIAEAKAAIKAEDLQPLRDEVTEDDPDYLWANSLRIKQAVELEAMHKREHVTQDQLNHYKAEALVLAERAVEQQELEQKLKAAEDTYLLYAKKREEARISDAMDSNGILNVAVVQQAPVPVLPDRPLWLGLAITLVAALVFGTAAVFVADYVDPSVRSPREAAEILGAPVLVSLPAKVIADRFARSL